MSDDVPSPAEFLEACVCIGLNRAARATTRRYDATFREAGLTSGQFSLLAALNRESPVPLSRLADLLCMDRTTLNRNVRLLEEGGLVASFADPDDARVRALGLTAKGLQMLRAALPLWRQAQRESEALLEGKGWDAIKQRLNALSG